ncbi:MAG: divalent-cation tolerance protein CutA [Candidatus Thorarchaeota archaeon]
MMTDYIIVQTTCPPDEADTLAKALVEEKVVACVNIVPGLSSVYWWQGKIEVELESLLLMKTERERKDTLWKAIRKYHSYDVPEFVIINIADGSADYLKWISESIH